MAYYRNAFLLDDDPIANFLLESTLKDEQLARRIFSFTSFQALFNAFIDVAESNSGQEDLPDLLLLDMHMPGKDGFEVLDQLLAIPGIGGNRVCVFLMSASYDHRLEEKLKEYPISGYLVKPLTEADIPVLVRSAVRDECDLE